MISVAVCDDEKGIRDYIRSAVLDCLAAMDLDGRVTEFDDGEPLCAAYESGEADFDMILLDITMKRCDGLTAAKRIRAVNGDVMIVFITASAEYVFSGYEVRAFRYLLKPELAHGFAGVFRECVEELTKSNEVRYSFKTLSGAISLPVRDILYFESWLKKTIIVTRQKEDEFYAPLKDIYEELKNKKFFYCHKSILVNYDRVAEFHYDRLVLDNGKELEISQSKRKEVRRLSSEMGME